MNNKSLKVLYLHAYAESISTATDRLSGVPYPVTIIDSPFPVKNLKGEHNCWMYYEKDGIFMEMDIPEWRNVANLEAHARGSDESIELVQKILNEEKFNCIMGFSQGAALINMMLQRNLLNDIKFIVMATPFICFARDNKPIQNMFPKIIILEAENDTCIVRNQTQQVINNYSGCDVIRYKGDHCDLKAGDFMRVLELF